ncbi:MAG TPA: hypothetical protein VD837_10880 [Terriglobales bacterium]|nr:hypothetical protein [Terriglobales bacterium]
MKRILSWFALSIFLTGVAWSQSLGDVAREVRKTERQRKKAARVYTNDDIPSVVAPAPSSDAAAEASKTDVPKTGEPTSADAKASNSEKNSDAKAPGDSDAELKSMYESYRGRLDAQKAAVQLLEREISVLQRENQIQASAYYQDAGTRLKDGKNWYEARTKRDAEIAEKKKLLDEARQSLDSIREEARKSGVPATFTE